MTIEAPAEDVAARHIADLVKEGQGEQVGQQLAINYLDVAKSGESTRDFLNKIQSYNEADRRTDANLPGLEIDVDLKGNLRADITRPGAIMGNTWRDKEEVFADIQSGEVNIGGGPFVGGNATAISERHGWVQGFNNAHVIATMDSAVTANMNSDVTAERGSLVWAMETSTVTAQEGSFINAWGHSQVTAENGAIVQAKDYADVTAKKGSTVGASGDATVHAQAGSYVLVAENAHVIADPGAHLLKRTADGKIVDDTAGQVKDKP